MLYSPKLFQEFEYINAAIGFKSLPEDELLHSVLIPIHENDIPGDVVCLKQIHGDKIYDIVEKSAISDIGGKEGDGFVTIMDNVVLQICTADCAPIALFDIDGSAIALLHAGWRGIEAGIIEKGIFKLLTQEIQSERLFAYIGPTIGKLDYEVSDEFQTKFPDSIIQKDGRFFLDISGEICKRLEKQGVVRIARFPLSTYSTNWIHSYRRDRENTGRNFFYLWKTL